MQINQIVQLNNYFNKYIINPVVFINTEENCEFHIKVSILYDKYIDQSKNIPVTNKPFKHKTFHEKCNTQFSQIDGLM